MDKIKTLTEDEVKQYDHLKRKHTVYLITNLKNSKIYVGVHSTKNAMDDYMGSGYHLKFSQKKYGIENFKKEIIAIFDNRKDALELEKGIVNEDFVKRDDTYNLMRGGNGIKLDSWNCKEITKQRISKSNTGKKRTPEMNKRQSELRKGKKLSPETCKKIGDGNRNKYVSPETKKKQSEAAKGNTTGQGRVWVSNEELGINRFVLPDSPQYKELLEQGYKVGRYKTEALKNVGSIISEKLKGIPRTEEWRRNLSIANKGRVVSSETKEKLRAFNTGKHHSPETKAKMSESHKGNLASTGYVWIKNEKLKEHRLINPETDEYKELIKTGEWESGRYTNQSGVKWIKNETLQKQRMLKPESDEFKQLLSEGWVLGQLKRAA